MCVKHAISAWGIAGPLEVMGRINALFRQQVLKDHAG